MVQLEAVNDNHLFAEKNSYVTVLCLGYIKPWVTSRTSQDGAKAGAEEEDVEDDSDSVNLNSLIAVGLPLGNNRSRTTHETQYD